MELGLLEVVKFLIEDKGVDPNEYGWTFSDAARHRVHLVSAAMTSGQEEVFQYLLSLPSTNLYSEIENNDARDWTNGLFEQALDVYVVRNGPKAYLTSIANHNRFDVNRACHRYGEVFSNFTCLFIALKRLRDCLDDTFEVDNGSSGNEGPNFTEAGSTRLDRYINAIKLLLEAGANPNQNVLVFGAVSTGIGLVESWLRVSRLDIHGSPVRILRQRVYRQVLKMLKRGVKAP